MTVRASAGAAVVLLLATGCGMPPTSDWNEYAFGDVLTFRSPVPLDRTAATGIDTNVGEWAGGGVRVLIDHGLFADPLTGQANRPQHRLREESIDGVAARVVTYTRPDGGHVAAAHFPDLGARARTGAVRLTLIAEADTLDEATLLALVRSIRFTGTASSDPT